MRGWDVRRQLPTRGYGVRRRLLPRGNGVHATWERGTAILRSSMCSELPGIMYLYGLR